MMVVYWVVRCAVYMALHAHEPWTWERAGWLLFEALVFTLCFTGLRVIRRKAN